MKYTSEKLEKRDGDIVYRHKQDSGSFVSYSSTPTLQKYDLQGFRLILRLENWRGSGNTVFQKVQKFSFDFKGAKKSTQPAIVYRTRAHWNDPWSNLPNDSTFPSTDPFLTKEVYEDNFSTKKLTAVTSSNKPCIKTEDLPEEYNGATNRSSSIILPSDAPKIFQGTESSFVVIESPFEPAPQGGHSSHSHVGVDWGSHNYNVTSDWRAHGDAKSYWQRYKPTSGKSPYRAIYSTLYGTVSFQGTVLINNHAPNSWSSSRGNYMNNSSQLYHIIQFPPINSSANSYSGNGQWIAEPHTDATKGFLFWSTYDSSNQKIQGSGVSIQKSMLFKEGQTVIDTSDFWHPASEGVSENTNGFKAIIVPWTEGMDTRLQRRWLLSSNRKLLKYYATDFMADWNVLGTGDLELSTPTNLSV